MSIETVAPTTRNQTYDKTIEKKYEGASIEKTPFVNPSLTLPSNVPLIIDKLSIDTIFHPPKSTIQKSVFNPSA